MLRSDYEVGTTKSERRSKYLIPLILYYTFCLNIAAGLILIIICIKTNTSKSKQKILHNKHYLYPNVKKASMTT